MEKNIKPKTTFPKDFFQKMRPTISNKETFKEVTPIKWKQNRKAKNNKIIAFSTKEKQVL